MSFELTVALRYIWTARKRAHTAFLALISTLGLAVGVATLLISLALLSGLQGQIKERLMSSSPRLLVEAKGRNTIENASAVVEAGARLGAGTMHQIVSGMAWGANGEDNKGEPARVRSFDAGTLPPTEETFGRVWKIPDGDHPVYVTRDFAASLGLTLGDEVTVVSPRTKLTPFGPVPLWKKYTITRLVENTGDDRSADAWLPFDEASRLFGTNGEPTSIEAYESEPSRIDALKDQLASKFPNLTVKSWKDVNRPLFLALRLEKVVMFATISLIIFVAALNLISSLSMMIVEKRPQVGILRTLGASERGILMIFLAVGLIIGIIGTIAGNVIGLGVSWAANKYGLVPLPGDVYYLRHIPFSIDLPDVLGVNAVAVVLSILATWYPARIASRLDPITAIRDE